MLYCIVYTKFELCIQRARLNSLSDTMQDEANCHVICNVRISSTTNGLEKKEKFDASISA